MTDNLSAFKERLISRNYDFKENEPLKNHTSFKIGGNCSFLVCPRTQEQFIDILRCCREWNIKKYMIGKGSNILASDDGFDGVIITFTAKQGLHLQKYVMKLICMDCPDWSLHGGFPER